MEVGEEVKNSIFLTNSFAVNEKKNEIFYERVAKYFISV